MRSGDIEMQEGLFEKQAELNKRTGFYAKAFRSDFDPQMAGVWLNNYTAAMSNELEELRAGTLWKHRFREAKDGKRFYVHDLQNARVAVTDMLFFRISLAQCLWPDGNDVFGLYKRRLQVNHSRQDSGYSTGRKTGADKQGIV